MKTCRVCQVEKDLSQFSFDKYAHDGYCSRCKSCRRNHYLANRERESERQREYWIKNHEWYKKTGLEYYYANKEERSRKMAEWYQENKQVVKENSQRWREANRERVAGYTRERRKMVNMATPKWADKAAIENIYQKARDLTSETGIPHCVDHIVPIKSRKVCGLHCEENLQIITISENSSKSNKLESISTI